METKHTPTPYVFNGASTVASLRCPEDMGNVIAVAPDRGASLGRWAANAAFIVRACNAHEDLLAQLKQVAIENNVRGFLDPNVALSIDAAIAKAEGR